MAQRDQQQRLWTPEAILTLMRPTIKRLINRALSGDGIGGDPIDHGTLDGLADDDHTQYALADKSRPATWVEAADLAGRSIADLGTKDHDLLDGLADDDHTQYLPDVAGTGGDAVNVTSRAVNFDPDKPASAVPVRTDETAFQDVGVGVRKATLGEIADLADLATIGGAPDDASYLVVGLHADLSNERIVSFEDGVQAVDGGAGGTYTVTADLDNGLGLGPGGITLDLRTLGGLNLSISGLWIDPTLTTAMGTVDLDNDVLLINDTSATNPKIRNVVVRDLGNSLAYANTTDSTAITATSETDFDINVTIPANTLKVGDVFRWYAASEYVIGFGSTGNFQFKAKAGSVILLDFASQAYGSGAAVTSHSRIECISVVRSIGATGTILTTWKDHSARNGLIIPSTGAGNSFNLATVDTTAAQVFKWSGQWGDAGNTITMKNFVLDLSRGGF